MRGETLIKYLSCLVITTFKDFIYGILYQCDR